MHAILIQHMANAGPRSIVRCLGAAALLARALHSIAASAQPPTVRSSISEEDGFRARSYWFRTDRGTVLIDPPFLIDQSERLRSELSADAALPVGAVVLTGCRPEHSWGLAALATRETRVWASKSQADALDREFGRARAFWLRAGLATGRLPQQPPKVTNRFSQSLNLGFEGFTLRLVEAETTPSPMTLAMIPETGDAFVGDLVWVKTHPLTEELELTAWRDGLARLKSFRPKRILPGHGEPGGMRSIDEFLSYLEFFEAAVRPLVQARKAVLSPREIAQIRRVVVRRYPDYALPSLLDRSIPYEFERQRKRRLAAGE